MSSMTPLEHAARGVRDHYGITDHAASVAIVLTYAARISNDPELWDPVAKTLTDEGACYIVTAIADGADNPDDVLIDALAYVVKTRADLLIQRDALIRAAMTTKLNRMRIATTAGFTALSD
jgi:hypothetical protein